MLSTCSVSEMCVAFPHKIQHIFQRSADVQFLPPRICFSSDRYNSFSFKCSLNIMNAKWLGLSCHILPLYLGVVEKASKCKILGCKAVQKEGSL